MKKLFFILISSFVFLLISTTISYFLQFVIDLEYGYLLLIGVGIAIVSLILAISFKIIFSMKYVCFVINAISLGFMMRSWYIYRELNNPLWVLYLVAIALVLYIILFYLLSYIPSLTKHYGWFCGTYFLVTLIVYVYLIEHIQTTYLSTFGLYLIIQIPLIIVLCIKSEGNKILFSNILKASFSIFMIALILLIIMFDGDAEIDAIGDSIDLSNPTENKKKSTTI